MEAVFIKMIAFFQSLLASWRIRNAEIDPNSKCPSCGARNGKLKCVEVESKEGKTWMVQRTCQICSAQCYEPTLVDPKIWAIADLKPLPPRPS